ncbi:hypothetical protein GCM10011585_00260 [Edaphobacter dinghuensis]|uniref:Uncharacterized protein n=1 Tax=Edaphobacter dinghuensis TaxID=1560005 RepID=A0A917GZL1_9BACT|nr:hypothetical protein GCM10011585_00260 [Edaphobacter dinghuensis]
MRCGYEKSKHVGSDGDLSQRKRVPEAGAAHSTEKGSVGREGGFDNL